MLYVKAICGFVVHTHFNLSEGEIAPIDNDKCDFTVKRLEDRGIIKIFDDYEKAFKFEFKKVSELAAESLASMNPGLDFKGNPLPTPLPTFDFEKSLPIVNKKEEVITEPIKKEPVSEPIKKEPVSEPIKKDEKITKIDSKDNAKTNSKEDSK